MITSKVNNVASPLIVSHSFNTATISETGGDEASKYIILRILSSKELECG